MRPLDENVVRERVRDLESNPPAHNLRLMVVMEPGVRSFSFKCRVRESFLPSVAGVYYVLSGQHLFAASQRIRTRCEKARIAPPRYLFRTGVRVIFILFLSDGQSNLPVW